MAAFQRVPWPILKRYDGEHLRRLAMPLGGIGTGTVSLGGRGDLRDWELMSRPAKGFIPTFNTGHRPTAPFFALRLQAHDKAPLARVLEGPLDPADYEGGSGCTIGNAGLPRFAHASVDAAYPFGQVNLHDPDLPVRVRLEAFNPLIPGDTNNSSLPVAVLRYVLINEGPDDLRATVCGNIPNFIGTDGWTTIPEWDGVPAATGADQNRNQWRAGRGVQGLFMELRAGHRLPVPRAGTDHARGGIRPCHRRAGLDEFPGGPAPGGKCPAAWRGRRRRPDGLPHEALPRMVAQR